MSKLVDKRYRQCSCGANMSVTLETDDTGKATRIVWENVYPVGDVRYNSNRLFGETADWRLRCQMCGALRQLNTFKS